MELDLLVFAAYQLVLMLSNVEIKQGELKSHSQTGFLIVMH